MRSLALLPLCAALALAACGPGSDDTAPAPAGEAPAAEGGPAAPGAALPLPPSGPTPEDEAVLGDRDCRAVAQAYVDALETGRFDFAARFWNDPVIDGARLDALFEDYVTPRVTIADIQEEGAAGSLYCTVTGELSDASDPRIAPRMGEIVLRRVNDVPGATEQQLRWTIRSSTFVEPMERSGNGRPA